ncbi:MAG: PhzF family phenazine biosynthesis protein [Alphaproteobacteria bacterium]|jgi:PhzF family phenazine biosynthesis protein|nr:PhzF family phenazine biosynthesis protein [Alphaproteobacteria bacterium]
MQIPIYQIDAFTSVPFEGNPAAVCPLPAWLPDRTLQAIALENNLSETAFTVPDGDDFHLRWFTPTVEVDLCGHATLATAYLILNRLSPDRQAVAFKTLSGTLRVAREDDGLVMDFPALPPGEPMQPGAELLAAMGAEPVECRPIREVHGAPYLFLVYRDEAEVAALAPKFADLGANVIATAPGDGVGFVSRFFAPMSGIDEDPVTGSAHCTLTPYWAERLGVERLRARQISARGGGLGCRLAGDRVFLAGDCAFYLEGSIEVPE